MSRISYPSWSAQLEGDPAIVWFRRALGEAATEAFGAAFPGCVASRILARSPQALGFALIHNSATARPVSPLSHG